MSLREKWRSFRRKLRWLDPFTYVDEFVMPVVNPRNSEVLAWAVYILSALVFAWAFYALLGFVLSTPTPIMIVVSGSMEPLMHRGDLVLVQGVQAEQLKGQQVPYGSSLEKVPLHSFATTLCSHFNETERQSPCVEFFPEFREGPPYGFETVGIHLIDDREIFFDREGDIIIYRSPTKNEDIIHRVLLKVIADDTYLLTKGDNQKTNPFLDQEIIGGAAISPYLVRADSINGKAVLFVPLIGCAKLWLFDGLSSLVLRGRLPEEFRGIC